MLKPYFSVMIIVATVLLAHGAVLAAGYDSQESQWGLPTIDEESKAVKNRIAFQPAENIAKTVSLAGLTVKVDRNGQVEINFGDSSYLVDSCFSYPGANDTAGWNSFGYPVNTLGYPDVASQHGPQDRWRVFVKQKDDPNVIIVKGGASTYTVERTITVHEDRIDFQDLYRNRTPKPIGIMVRHGVISSKDFLEQYSTNFEVAANPTIFMRGEDGSVGMVMNDSFSRRRLRPSINALNSGSAHISRYALDRGGSNTLSWSIYLMKSDEGYFDFINKVRAEWNASVTIDGPWIYGMLLPEGDDIKFFLPYGKEFYLNEVEKDPKPLQEYFEWRGTKMLSMAPWLYHDPGAMDHSVTKEEYRELMTRFVPLIHRIAPQVKILANVETDWVSFRRENIDGGDQIPVADRSQVTGPSLVVPVDAEVSKLIEKSLPEWKDSFVRDAQGRFEAITYYRGGKAVEQPPIRVFPEVGNKRYQHMMDHIKFCIEELGMDGVYCDEFVLGQYGSVRTYGQWDGISGEVHYRDGKLYDLYKDCSLAGIQARVNFINYVKSKGKIFVANRQSTSAEEQSLQIPRFTETGSALGPLLAEWEVGTRPKAHNYMFYTLLNTPLGLGVFDMPEGEQPSRWIMKAAIGYLRHGMVFYPYGIHEPPMTEENKHAFSIFKHMFPITPVELGEGFIVGQERILAARSIEKTWQADHKPTVLVFDINGKPADTAGKYELIEEDGKWRVILTLNDWSEVAVVE